MERLRITLEVLFKEIATATNSPSLFQLYERGLAKTGFLAWRKFNIEHLKFKIAPQSRITHNQSPNNELKKRKEKFKNAISATITSLTKATQEETLTNQKVNYHGEFWRFKQSKYQRTVVGLTTIIEPGEPGFGRQPHAHVHRPKD